jgi:hypothetical protein
MKNKKGIMLKFLLTIILAIIIFVPACYLTQKIFRTSTQAKDNYVDFVKDMDELASDARQGIGSQSTVLLIMDTATAIVYFEKGKEEVLVEVDARPPYSNYIIHLKKPTQCDNEKNCLCLFRKSKFDSTFFEISKTITVNPMRVVCTNLDYSLEIDNCGIGEAESVNSYKCSNGFMIERHLADESSWSNPSYYKIARRSLLQIIKLDQTLRIVGQKDG